MELVPGETLKTHSRWTKPMHRKPNRPSVHRIVLNRTFDRFQRRDWRWLRERFRPKPSPNRGACFAAIAAVFFVSRIVLWGRGIRFDAEPLQFYWQYIDPALLQHDFWRSLFYLEQQPPVFNFFLGAILHLVPRHPALGLLTIYFCLGLALSAGLFALMDRMKVDRRIALILAIVFALSPSTVLYENLLFYEYPLTLLLCVAALFLHRYATAGRLRDGIVFFSSLALISGIRSVYHLVWFGTIVVFVSAALRERTRRTLLAAALPGALLLVFYAKHLILFHNLVPGGGIYRAMNLATMTLEHLPPGALDPLIESGSISPILRTDIFEFVSQFETPASQQALAKISPPPPRTGIPVLDECIKSTDAINWNCVWLANLGAVYEKDSFVVLRHHPTAYLQSVLGNVSRYFLPDTDHWPFDGRSDDRNEQILARPLAAYNLLLTGEWPPRLNRPWLSYFVLPGLIGFGLFKVVRWRKSHDPTVLILAFMVGNMIYLTVVVLLLTFGDQNRYRSEISPYFTALLGIFLTDLLGKLCPDRARQNREQSMKP
jgi:hypothetical protein